MYGQRRRGEIRKMGLYEVQGDGGGQRWRERRARKTGAECSYEWKLPLPLMAGTSNDAPPTHCLNMVSAFSHVHEHTHNIHIIIIPHVHTSHTHLKACKNLPMAHTQSSTPSRNGEQRESVMMHHFLKHLYPSSLSHHLSLSAFHPSFEGGRW